MGESKLSISTMFIQNKKSDPEGPLFLCCHSCSEEKKGSFNPIAPVIRDFIDCLSLDIERYNFRKLIVYLSSLRVKR